MDGHHGQGALDRDEASGAGVPGLQLHAGQPVGDCAHAGAPVALQVHTEQPQLAERQGHLRGEGADLIPLGDVGPDGLVHQAPNAVLHGQLLVIEQMVDVKQF